MPEYLINCYTLNAEDTVNISVSFGNDNEDRGGERGTGEVGETGGTEAEGKGNEINSLVLILKVNETKVGLFSSWKKTNFEKPN